VCTRVTALVLWLGLGVNPLTLLLSFFHLRRHPHPRVNLLSELIELNHRVNPIYVTRDGVCVCVCVCGWRIKEYLTLSPAPPPAPSRTLHTIREAAKGRRISLGQRTGLAPRPTKEKRKRNTLIIQLDSGLPPRKRNKLITQHN